MNETECIKALEHMKKHLEVEDTLFNPSDEVLRYLLKNKLIDQGQLLGEEGSNDPWYYFITPRGMHWDVSLGKAVLP